MKRYERILNLALIGCAASATGAQGATHYFTNAGGDGLWNNSNNWESSTSCSNLTGAGAVPTASDDAVICSNKTADITDVAAVAKTVTVQLVGKIRINPNTADASLTLGSGTSGTLTSSLSGPIELHAGTSPNEATLAFTALDHTLSGSSVVDGADDDAQVSVLTSGKKLTLSANSTIRGQLVINGSGNFENLGSVTANAVGGTLKVAIGGTLTDGSGDRWKIAVGATTVELLFDSTIGTVGTLEGNFVVPAGTLQIDHAITTIVSRPVQTSNRSIFSSRGISSAARRAAT